jgi:TRAP-type C4-dicarboxylate transport system permease large subunit
MLTPPVGHNLFAIISSSNGQIDAPQMHRGILPFLVTEGVVLLILPKFPAIALFLPNLML